MRRQVIVFWEGNPIATRVVDGSRPIQVGPAPSADVVLPTEATLEGEGDAVLGAFVVSISRTTPADTIRAPWRVGRGAWSTALSALLHVLMVAGVGIIGSTSRAEVGADDGSDLAAMKGYLARSSARDGDETVSPSRDRVPSRDPVRMTATDLSENPEPTAVVVPVAVPAASKSGQPWNGDKAERGAIGAGSSGTANVGDWYGTYTCSSEVLGLTVHIEPAGGSDVLLLGTATNRLGVHSSYKQHGVQDPVTGEARFLNDGWVGRPMSGYKLTGGMHGRFSGDTFSGVVDDPNCGAVTLRRRRG